MTVTAVTVLYNIVLAVCVWCSDIDDGDWRCHVGVEWKGIDNIYFRCAKGSVSLKLTLCFFFFKQMSFLLFFFFHSLTLLVLPLHGPSNTPPRTRTSLPIPPGTLHTMEKLVNYIPLSPVIFSVKSILSLSRSLSHLSLSLSLTQSTQ